MASLPSVINGNSLEVMAAMPEACVDSIVTDPPYELGFMGKKWDSSGIAYNVDLWTQALRVLKPGGHLLAFGGTRTYHRMTVAIEDAGFEIRDSISWLRGSGFPKSLDVSKAIDKAAGVARTEVLGSKRVVVQDKQNGTAGIVGSNGNVRTTARVDITAPATDAAKQWQGWGTALKPACEPIVVARKPLHGTVAANVLRHGTGALNIDASRVADAGRWPANVILDPDAAAELDRQSGASVSRVGKPRTGKSGDGYGMIHTGSEYNDSGGASRFFYCAKPGKTEKLAGVPPEATAHPTVKPMALMRYLCRLVTPPNGVVLDPFAGSGTTLVAATLEGFGSIGIELTSEYLPIIRGRLAWATSEASKGAQLELPLGI